jgi:hypothetical protein
MKTDSSRNENFFEQHTSSTQRKFWLDCAVDVKSSMVEQNQKSTVTTNGHAVLIVYSHLPLLPLPFFSAPLPLLLFSLFLATHAAKRSFVAGRPVPPPTTSVQTQDGGLAFATRGQCNQRCNEHPHCTNMLQIKGGHLNLWKDSNTVAIAVIVAIANVTAIVPIVVVIVVIIVIVAAVAITVAVTIVTGCCHCCQDNQSLTVFDISYAFLHMETGGCCPRLHHRTEGDGSGKPKSWKVVPGLA